MPKVVITGANGHLGTKLAADLAPREGYALVRLGHGAGTEAMIDADLARYDPAWADAFAGADAVVHLAANPSWTAQWSELVGPNIDAVLNVGRAAVEHGVGRIVFASSNWVMAGHRFGEDVLTASAPPAPVNGYGATKLFGERHGRHLHEAHGVGFVALRIGWVQRERDNRPGPHMTHGRWGQEMWLSDRDFRDCVRHAIEAPDVGFAIVNAMSDNPGMRWDLAGGEAAIGWRPQDGARPQMPMRRRVESRLKRAQWRLFGPASTRRTTLGW